jgi:RNA polymerase sigma factor (TIGR02999 family)
LVDKARRKLSQKQGGLLQRIELDSAAAIEENSGDDLMALDEALTRLEQQWPDKAKLVKLKYFAGLTIAEASQTMGISTATAERYWRFARAWLHSQLKTRD